MTSIEAIASLALWPWGLLLGALAGYLAVVAALLAAGRREHARALIGLVPDCLVLVKRLLADPATPRRQRLWLGALVAYLASPLDLIPDFVPVAGQLDDVVIVTLALRAVLRSRGEAAIRAAWPGPESSLRVILRAAGARSGGRDAEATL
jgi:uncharacterized membrane protein YkvA (DUF1232 family)